MDLRHAPFDSPLGVYERQAADLLAAHRAADPEAIDLLHRKHPRFLDEAIPWLPKSIPDSEIREAALTLDDARLAIARFHDFADWAALESYVAAVGQRGPVFVFESAVEGVVSGDLAAVEEALRAHPELVRARSARICCFDPPVHRATLLHYIAANGVEGYRQKTPANAVEFARALLDSGAEVDALADMYGGQWTTLGLLVSSSHPARAGLQAQLTELLLDFGAARGADRSVRRGGTGTGGRSGASAPGGGRARAAPRAGAGGSARARGRRRAPARCRRRSQPLQPGRVSCALHAAASGGACRPRCGGADAGGARGKARYQRPHLAQHAARVGGTRGPNGDRGVSARARRAAVS